MALFNLSKDTSDFGTGTWDLDLAVDPANFLDDCSNLLRLGFVEWSPVKLNTPQSAQLGRVESARAAPDFAFIFQRSL